MGAESEGEFVKCFIITIEEFKMFCSNFQVYSLYIIIIFFFFMIFLIIFSVLLQKFNEILCFEEEKNNYFFSLWYDLCCNEFILLVDFKLLTQIFW